MSQAPGLTPEGIVNRIRRNSRYPRAEWGSIETATIIPKLWRALEVAETYIARISNPSIPHHTLRDTIKDSPEPPQP